MKIFLKRVVIYFFVFLFSFFPKPDLLASIIAVFRKNDTSNNNMLILSQNNTLAVSNSSKHESHASHASHSSGTSSSSSSGSSSNDVGTILLATGITAGVVYLVYWIKKSHVLSRSNFNKKPKIHLREVRVFSKAQVFGEMTYATDDDSCSICVELQNPSTDLMTGIIVKASILDNPNLRIVPKEKVISSILPNQTARAYFSVLSHKRNKYGSSKIRITFEGDFVFNPKDVTIEIPY